MIVQALPFADFLEHDGEALVLTEGALVRLSAIGAAVIGLAAGGVDGARLATHLEERFGTPETGSTAAALDPILQALAGQGLVQLLPDDPAASTDSTDSDGADR